MLPSAISQNCTSTYQVMGLSNKPPPLTSKNSQEPKQDVSPARKNLQLLQVQEDFRDTLPSTDKKSPSALSDHPKNEFKYPSAYSTPTQSPKSLQNKHTENEGHQVKIRANI